MISKESNVKSGVPQGTVLGPLLFLLKIDSLSDLTIESVVGMFADDTRVTKHVKTDEDMESLQEDLEILYKWQEDNNMKFNSTKFENLSYGKNEDLKNNTNFLTPNAENIIEGKESLRDLGIIMNYKADFTDHINHVCAKVNQKSGWIMRTFIRRDEYFLKFMWKTNMQGHIDYCSQLWQPMQSHLLQRIEGLQRAYTKNHQQYHI